MGGVGGRQTPLLHTRNKAPNREAGVFLNVAAGGDEAITIGEQVEGEATTVSRRREPPAAATLVAQSFVVAA